MCRPFSLVAVVLKQSLFEKNSKILDLLRKFDNEAKNIDRNIRFPQIRYQKYFICALPFLIFLASYKVKKYLSLDELTCNHLNLPIKRWDLQFVRRVNLSLCKGSENAGPISRGNQRLKKVFISLSHWWSAAQYESWGFSGAESGRCAALGAATPPASRLWN